MARTLEQIRNLCPAIPEEADLGYHFCFGTLGGWPRFAPADLSGVVDLANTVTAAPGHRVDWIHLPILDRTDDGFFEPLARLKPGGARVYLGVIHNMERFPQRVAAARKVLPEFGVAAYCGFGRLPPSDMPAVLEEHLRAVTLAR